MVHLMVDKKKKISGNVDHTIPIEEFIDLRRYDENTHELEDIGEIKRLESKLENLKRDHHKKVHVRFNQE